MENEIKSHDWAIGYQVGWGNGIQTQKREEIEFLEKFEKEMSTEYSATKTIFLIRNRLKELKE